MLRSQLAVIFFLIFFLYIYIKRSPFLTSCLSNISYFFSSDSEQSLCWLNALLWTKQKKKGTHPPVTGLCTLEAKHPEKI